MAKRTKDNEEEAPVVLAEEGPSGLTYIVRNFHISRNINDEFGRTIKVLGWNEGDEMIDDGGEESMPHDQIVSLAHEGYIRLKGEE